MGSAQNPSHEDYSSPPTAVQLLAEEAYASPSHAWTIAAVVSAVIGAALLVLNASKRRNAALPPVIALMERLRICVQNMYFVFVRANAVMTFVIVKVIR